MTEKKYDLTSFTRRWTALHPMPPLQHAIHNVKIMGYRPILALLKTGAKLDAVDAHGATALHEAVARREPDIYALLVQASANPDLADAGGTTPAMLFEDVFGMTYEEKFRDRKIDADHFRIRKQATPEQVNEDHAFAPAGSASHPVPPLQHAVHHSDSAGIEPVLALLEGDADLDAVDARGCTALHQAVFDDRPDIYALLVQAGADPHIENRPGWTAARFFEQYYGPFEHSYWGVGVDADHFRRQHADS